MKVYIGQAGDCIETRDKKHHCHNQLYHTEKSAMAKHSINMYYCIQLNGISILVKQVRCMDRSPWKWLRLSCVLTLSSERMGSRWGGHGSPSYTLWRNGRIKFSQKVKTSSWSNLPLWSLKEPLFSFCLLALTGQSPQSDILLKKVRRKNSQNTTWHNNPDQQYSHHCTNLKPYKLLLASWNIHKLFYANILKSLERTYSEIIFQDNYSKSK